MTSPMTSSVTWGRALWRRPLVRFLSLGALLFALDRAVSDAPPELLAGGRQIVELPAEELIELREDWRSRTGRWPTPVEERGLVEGWFANEVLFREAMAHGLDRNDLIVQRRLISKMQFLAEDPSAPPPELYQQALALGLDRHDPIVRQRLIQRMRMLLENGQAPQEEPGEEELRSFYERHPERFQEPERLRLEHIFLSAEARGTALERDASALLARLLQGTAGEPLELGDPFFVPATLPASSAEQLERHFGPEWPRQLADCPVETWCGPLVSAYGLHLVRVVERWPAGVAPFEDVRHELRLATLEEKRRQRLAAERQRLEQRYALIVHAPNDSVPNDQQTPVREAAS